MQITKPLKKPLSAHERDREETRIKEELEALAAEEAAENDEPRDLEDEDISEIPLDKVFRR